MRPTTSDPFVPNGDNRRNTLILLLGTAEEFGIDAHAVKSDSKRTGFYITQELADVLYEDGGVEEIEVVEAPDDEPEDMFDVGQHSIPQVKDFVAEFPETLADVLASEQEGQNRVTLVEWLTAQQTSGNRAEKNTDTEE